MVNKGPTKKWANLDLTVLLINIGWTPLYLDHFMNVTLESGELCRIFDLDEDDEVEVMPHVVLVPRVLLEGHVLVVKSLALQT